MSAEEILKQIQEVDQELKMYIREKMKIQTVIENLREKKIDLKALYNLKLSDQHATWETWIDKHFPWQDQMQGILINKFHLKEFWPQQKAAINATLSKKDTILIMPTGGGKSLCYQLPAIIDSGMTLVISPLISLMEDQLLKLKELNILGYKLVSHESNEAKKAIYAFLNKKQGPCIKLLYISPEMLVKSKKLMSALQTCYKAGDLNRIAIDEIHCCSEWGHDFRPDYAYLGLLKDVFKDIPIIGLTATATLVVLNDIRNMLNIPGATIIKAPFDRPNLVYKVMLKPHKLNASIEMIRDIITSEFEGCSGIIYTNTIKECEEVVQMLRSLNVKAALYHAQLENEHKTKIYNKWMQNVYQVVVATIAFGLGIDKPDVRFVIHYTVTKSIEELYQQSGRAGRDGKSASCIILFRLSDYLKQLAYAKSLKDANRTSAVLKYILNVKNCRHELIARCFEENVEISCQKNCDNCLSESKVAIFSLVRPCKEIYKLLDNAEKTDTDLTLIKLIDLWHKTLKIAISKEDSELIIAHLIDQDYLKQQKSFTAYSVISYIIKSLSTLSEGIQIISYMPTNPALRRYLGPEPSLPKDCYSSDKGSKKRKIDDIIGQPSSSKSTL